MAMRGEREVREFFETAGVRKEIRRFPESTHNSELAARCLGVEVGQIAKTILLLADASPLAVVVSGDRRIDMRKVRALGHGKKVRLAGPEEVAAHTGFAVGAVSPVPLPPGSPSTSTGRCAGSRSSIPPRGRRTACSPPRPTSCSP